MSNVSDTQVWTMVKIRYSICPDVAYHAQHCIEGEGNVGDGRVTEVHRRSESLQVEHGLHGLMGGATVALFTGQFGLANQD